MPTITIPQTIDHTSLRELKPFIVQTISDVLNDPDFGLELSERARARLSRARKNFNRTVSFADIKRKHY